LAQAEFDRKIMLAEFDSSLEVCKELFGLDERLIYEVRNDFPRLISKNVPYGVKNATYEISGAAITEYQITWLELVESFCDIT
jgi:hypothetical protein